MTDFSTMWSGLDSAIIILYFVGIVAVGVFMRSKASTSMKSFFVASRRLTIPILIGVGAASWEDSWSIVGAAECGATMGVCIIFFYLIPTTILKLPVALWIGPRVRERFPDWVVTLPDMMSYLYDNRTKFVVALGILPQMFYDAAITVAGGEVIHYVTGINLWVSFGILGLICILYTSLSGLWGLAITDLIQFVIMTVSAGLLCLGVYSYFDGFGNLFAQADAIDHNLVTVFGGNGAMDVAAWLVSAVAIYANAQSYQRFGSARSAADLKVAYSFIVMFGQFFMAINVMAGLASRVMYPDIAAESSSQAFWTLVFTTLPIGLRGLFVASLIAAVMSTVSADYLVCGAAICHDIVKGTIVKNMTDKGDILGTRLSIWGIGIAMTFCTYFWQGGIEKAWYYVGGFSVSAFLVPLLFGLYYKKRTPAAGFYTMVCTIILYAVWEFLLKSPAGIPSNLIAFIFSFVLYIILCNLTYNKYKGTMNDISVVLNPDK
ncbi:MAG: sodium:solute symporter family protein [Firmicutes bacterium]|nr:sodium:solute symporter family protein [Bacillota bacterium]